MKDFLHYFFADLGWLNQHSWFGMFNTILIFLLLPLSLSKKIWASPYYRVLLLAALLTFITLSIISYIAPPIPGIQPDGPISTTSALYETLFRHIVITNDYTWFVIFNTLIAPIFLLGLRKQYWILKQYRQWVLVSFFILALCCFQGTFAMFQSKI